MIYVKNLPVWEQSLRIGLGMAAAAYAVLNLDSVWISPRQISRGRLQQLLQIPAMWSPKPRLQQEPPCGISCLSGFE